MLSNTWSCLVTPAAGEYALGWNDPVGQQLEMIILKELSEEDPLKMCVNQTGGWKMYEEAV